MLFGAAGAGVRYLLAGGVAAWMANGGSRTWLGAALGPGFPLATLLINVSGSFLLAFVTTLAAAGIVNADLRYALGTGFLGAYTTFSTFELETDALIRSGQGGLAAAYVLGNLLFGFAGVLLGRLMAAPFTGGIAGGAP